MEEADNLLDLETNGNLATDAVDSLHDTSATDNDHKITSTKPLEMEHIGPETLQEACSLFDSFPAVASVTPPSPALVSLVRPSSAKEEERHPPTKQRPKSAGCVAKSVRFSTQLEVN